jgi:hypothetical protein
VDTSRVVLWIQGQCCGSKGGAVDPRVVLWIQGWCCGSKGSAVDPRVVLWNGTVSSPIFIFSLVGTFLILFTRFLF